jgi:hypothetical protein
MKSIAFKTNSAGAYVVAGLLAISPAVAAQPSVATSDTGDRSPKRESVQSTPSAAKIGTIFGSRHRSILVDYYSDASRAGRCPSGLDKKKNTCMPPEQARTWAVGRQLAPDVIDYEVPPVLAVPFGPLPAGYRYVRVASDILVIEIGSRMVVDAIRDLERN